MTDVTAAPSGPASPGSPVSSKEESDRRGSIEPGVVVLVALFVLAAAVWGPFGIRPNGLIEEWTFYLGFDRGMRVIASQMIMPGQPNRPFVLLPYGLGYRLTPDSFVGVNLIHIMLFVGKGVLLAAVLRRLLPGDPKLAYWSAVLFVLHPADRGLVSIRLTAYHAAVFFFLLALYQLILYSERHSSGRLAGMWAAQALCLGTYEVALPLMVLTPLLLVWQERGVSRRVIQIAGLWLCVPIVQAAWTAAVLLRPHTYQHVVLGLGQEGAHDAWPYAYHLGRAYVRSFFTAWREVWGTVRNDLWLMSVGIAVAASAVLLVGLLGWRSSVGRPDTRGPARSVLIAAGTGIIIVGVGFAPFLPLPYHRTIDDRVFLFSSIGAAVTTVALLSLITRPLGRLASHVALGSVAVFALLGVLGQQQDIQVISTAVQRLLAGITREVPGARPGSLVVLLDQEHRLTGTDAFALQVTGIHFADAVRYLYRDPGMPVVFCDPSRGKWGFEEGCLFTPTGLALYSGAGQVFYAYDRIIVLEADDWNGVRLLSRLAPVGGTVPRAYRPEQLIVADRRAPRATSVLEPRLVAASAPFPRPRRGTTIEFDRPFLGFGWYPVAGSVAWMSAPRSGLQLWLRPDRSYRLSCRILHEIVPGLVRSMVLSVNDEPIPLEIRPHASGGFVVHGVVPWEAVARDPERTRITFRVREVYRPRSLGIAPDDRTLGLLFDSLRVRPLREPKAPVAPSGLFRRPGIAIDDVSWTRWLTNIAGWTPAGDSDLEPDAG